jgi:hypothetical protein
MIVTQTQIDNAIISLNTTLAENGAEIANALKKGCEPCETIFHKSIQARFAKFVLGKGLYFVNQECITNFELWQEVQVATTLANC